MASLFQEGVSPDLCVWYTLHVHPLIITCLAHRAAAVDEAAMALAAAAGAAAAGAPAAGALAAGAPAGALAAGAPAGPPISQIVRVKFIRPPAPIPDNADPANPEPLVVDPPPGVLAPLPATIPARPPVAIVPMPAAIAPPRPLGAPRPRRPTRFDK